MQPVCLVGQPGDAKIIDFAARSVGKYTVDYTGDPVEAGIFDGPQGHREQR